MSISHLFICVFTKYVTFTTQSLVSLLFTALFDANHIILKLIEVNGNMKIPNSTFWRRLHCVQVVLDQEVPGFYPDSNSLGSTYQTVDCLRSSAQVLMMSEKDWVHMVQVLQQGMHKKLHRST